MKEGAEVIFSKKNDDWYTPPALYSKNSAPAPSMICIFRAGEAPKNLGEWNDEVQD